MTDPPPSQPFQPDTAFAGTDDTPAVTDMIAMIDGDGRVQHISSGARDLLGHEPDELVGRKFRDLIHPTDAEGVPDGAEALATWLDDAIRGFRLRAATGDYAHIQSAAANLLDNPRFNALVLTLRYLGGLPGKDPRGSLLESAFHFMDESVLITDARLDPPGPTILHVNRSFSRITGYEPDEVLGRDPRFLQGPKTNRAVLDRLRRCCERGEVFRGEAINYRKDGSEFWMEWVIVPFRDNTGTITHFIATQRDVTVRKRLEQQVIDVAAREQRRMSEDLHGTLQQVLVAARMHADQLRGLVNAGGDYPENVAEGFDRLTQMLDAGKEQARQLSHGLHPIRVRTRGLADALEELALATRKLFDVTCAVGPVTGETGLIAPEAAQHLYRIAQEAVNNAIKHGRAKRIELALHCDEDWGTLRVDDDGSGMPDHLLGELATADQSPGMGLQIMLYRTRMIGGTLRIERRRDGLTPVGDPHHTPVTGTRIACDFPVAGGVRE